MKQIMFKVEYFHYSIPHWVEKKSIILDRINQHRWGRKTKISNFDQQVDTSFCSDYFNIDDILKLELADFCTDTGLNVNITRSWYQIYNTHDFHGPHTHSNEIIDDRDYSGVLFVDFDAKEHSATQFINPFPYKAYSHLFSPKVKEGDIIIFPSTVLHFSNPNTSSKTRTIVSFNLNLVDHNTLSSNYEYG